MDLDKIWLLRTIWRSIPVFVLLFVFCILALNTSAYQTKESSDHQPRSTTDDRNVLRQRVATIVAVTVAAGTGKTLDGISFYTPISPSNEALAKITRNADIVIPILEEYLWGKDTRSGLVAMRLVGSLRSPLNVAPLQRVAESHPLASFRSFALFSLTSAPREITAPILNKAVATDTECDGAPDGQRPADPSFQLKYDDFRSLRGEPFQSARGSSYSEHWIWLPTNSTSTTVFVKSREPM